MSKSVVAFGYAYVIAVLFNALLVVAKEKNTALKSWMAAATGHHWITHGILVIALFILIGFLLQRGKLRTGASAMAWWIAGATIASGAIIDGYFLFFG